MDYIVYKRFKQKALCGDVDLPELTQCKLIGNFISYKNKALCINTSQNAHMYFVRNDDNQGLLRGKLTTEIQKVLSKKDDDYQLRWYKVWQDKVCQKYKRTEQADHWLWNHDFYNANIFDLRYIAKLVGVKET